MSSPMMGGGDIMSNMMGPLMALHTMQRGAKEGLGGATDDALKMLMMKAMLAKQQGINGAGQQPGAAAPASGGSDNIDALARGGEIGDSVDPNGILGKIMAQRKQQGMGGPAQPPTVAGGSPGLGYQNPLPQGNDPVKEYLLRSIFQGQGGGGMQGGLGG